MKKEIKTKSDDKEYERFEQLLSRVVKVPKDEILRREKEEKERNKARKKR